MVALGRGSIRQAGMSAFTALVLLTCLMEKDIHIVFVSMESPQNSDCGKGPVM